MIRSDITLSDREFNSVRDLIYRKAGISLAPHKKPLVSGRLEKRLRQLDIRSYADYLSVVTSPAGRSELHTAIDLLTTNETYFFREPKHFTFLRNLVREQDRPGRIWRVWCGASSTGEEPYSIAITLADVLQSDRWEVLASDISLRVLEKARRGVYSATRLEEFPSDLLRRYCLKGSGSEAGNILINQRLRQRVRFAHINLNETLPDIGHFDIIFLRNVLIYFDVDTKRQVIERVCGHLVPNGYFFVSHSESLHGLAPHLTQHSPSIYRNA